MLEINMRCDDCQRQLISMECYCGFCADEERDQYAETIVQGIADDFLSTNQIGYPEVWPSDEYESAFKAGLQVGIEGMEVKFKQACNNYGVVLQGEDNNELDD